MTRSKCDEVSFRSGQMSPDSSSLVLADNANYLANVLVFNFPHSDLWLASGIPKLPSGTSQARRLKLLW